MATNSKYALLKQLKKKASLQLGPQSGGGSGGGMGGSGGKIPAGFLAGMNQKRDEEALAAKEESETAQARAMDDAAKQQDMQIKQVEMEQRIRDQTSEKMQEMQQEHSRLGIEAANLKEQLKNKDLMHKEQIKHMNALVKQQLDHQKMLDKQVESHRERMTTPFSTTLVSRSKSLRSLVEKMHKNAAQIVPSINSGVNGPAQPKSIGSSKIQVDTGAKTPLHTAQNPAAYGTTPSQPSVNNNPTPPPAAAGAQPAPAPQPQQPARNYWLNNVKDRLNPAIQKYWYATRMSAMPNAPSQESAISGMTNAYWNTFKNLRGDLNKGYDQYFKDKGAYQGKPGEDLLSGMYNNAAYWADSGFNRLQQGILNIPANTISTGAQAFGHAGEHFKDMSNRFSQANQNCSAQDAANTKAREQGQAQIDEQWNKDKAAGGTWQAAYNYLTGKYTPNAKADSAWQTAKDMAGQAKDWLWNQGGALAQGGKGIVNTGTAAADTALNMLPISAAIGAASSGDTESRGWDPFNTDAENNAQAAKVEADKKKILAESGGAGSTPPSAAPSFIPGAHGMNDAMRLQHTGYYHPGYINNPSQGAVDPITGMLLSPFTQTSGFNHGGGYNPEDMLGAFQNSVFDSRPGFNGGYNSFDQAFLNSQRQ